MIRNKNISSWINSYYQDRVQFTNWQGVNSETIKCNQISIVQGSALGPSMFISFINDLSKVSEYFCILFADDTNLLMSDKDPKTLEIRANLELKKVKDYFDANQLAINIDKSNFIIINNKKNENEEFHKFKIRIGNQILEEKSELEYLGIVIDNKLSFKSHFQKVYSKIKRNLSGLIQCKNLLTYQSKLLIYNSLIHSHLEYCPLIWMSNLQAKEINILKTLQKRAIRIVFGCKFNSHTSKLFKWSKITKVEDIFEKQSIIFCKKHQENNLPLAIMKIVNENLRNQDVMTRNSLTKNYSISDKIIKGDTMYDILASWNKQSEKIKNCKSLAILKKEFLIMKNVAIPCHTKNCYSCQMNIDKLKNVMKF